jgi:hypothetical protein
MTIDLTNYIEVPVEGLGRNIQVGDYAEVVYTPSGEDGTHVFSGIAWRPSYAKSSVVVGATIITQKLGQEPWENIRVTRIMREVAPLPTEPGFYLVRDINPDAQYIVERLPRDGWLDDGRCVSDARINRLHNEGRLFRVTVSETPTNHVN